MNYLATSSDAPTKPHSKTKKTSVVCALCRSVKNVGHKTSHRLIVYIILIFFYYGCGGNAKRPSLIRDQKTKESKAYSKPKEPKERQTQAIKPEKKHKILKRLAILPFTQQNFDGETTEIARKMVHNIFLSTSINVIPLENIEASLQKKGINRINIRQIPYKKLGAYLGADTLLYGTVKIKKDFLSFFANNHPIQIKLRIVSTADGKEIWRARGEQSTLKFKMLSLAKLFNFTFPENAKRSIRIAKQIKSSLSNIPKPLPPEIKKKRGPKISLLIHDSPSEIRKQGERVHLFLEGTPRCKGYFNIGSSFRNIPLKEVEAGIYYGEYLIKSKNDIVFSKISAVLANSHGSAKYWDVLGPVSFDTSVPKAPRGLTSLEEGRKGFISWKGNSEHDILKYAIYKSLASSSGYEMIATTQNTYYTENNLKYFTSYFYKVLAIDKARNKSPLTEYTKIFIIPPGPTYISDEEGFNQKTWYKKMGPYIISKNFTIPSGSSLLIEPGTAIRLNDGVSIHVEGVLYARGTRGNEIHFTQNSKQGAKWGGIVFYQTKAVDSIMEWCVIQGAKTAVTTSSSTTIKNCVITSNDFGIKTSKEGTRSQIENSDISGNFKTGIYITEKSSPVISSCNISKNQNNGITIETSSPKITKCNISKNKVSGIRITFSTPKIRDNNITENGKWNLKKTHPITQVLPVSHNWWGSYRCLEVLKKVSGRVDISDILDKPYPEGKSIKLNILKSPLGGEVTEDAYITKTFSPYVLSPSLVISKDATLTISPGVTIKCKEGDNSIILKRGQIIAEGTKSANIIFTSNKTNPKPGDYSSAVILSSLKGLSKKSTFKHCVLEYAQSGIIINSGDTFISNCLIRRNSQAGIKILNSASPMITKSVIVQNAGFGGIYCLENSTPTISHNNISDNAWAIQSFAKGYINAVKNWWGKNPPPNKIFMGNVDYNPWLSSPYK